MCIICNPNSNDSYGGLVIKGCPTVTSIDNIPANISSIIIENCINLTSISNIHSVEYLSVRDCKSLTVVDANNLPHCNKRSNVVKQLSIFECPALTNIFNIQGFQEVSCWRCPMLTTIQGHDHLYKLYVEDCAMLSTIHSSQSIRKLTALGKFNLIINGLNYPKLSELKIDNPANIPSDVQLCTLGFIRSDVETLPAIEGLKNLFYIDCPMLKSTPAINGLKILYLENCSSLTDIQPIGKMNKIYFSRCPNLNVIPSMYGLKKIYCDDGSITINFDTHECKTKIMYESAYPGPDFFM